MTTKKKLSKAQLRKLRQRIARQNFKVQSKKTKIRKVIKIAKKKKSYRKKGTNNDVMAVLGGMGYGAVREWMSTKIAPLTDKIPIANLGDEVGMLAISYLAKKGKIPFVNKIDIVKKAGSAGMAIESARIGEYLLRRGMNLSNTESTSSAGNGLLF